MATKLINNKPNRKLTDMFSPAPNTTLTPSVSKYTSQNVSPGKSLEEIFAPAPSQTIDYQARKNNAASQGDWEGYAINELLRNTKIDEQGLDYKKTYDHESIPSVSMANSLVKDKMFQNIKPYSGAELAKMYGLNIDADALEALYDRATKEKYDRYERELGRSENNLYDQFADLSTQQQDQTYRMFGESAMSGQNAGATFAQNVLAQQGLSDVAAQGMEKVAQERLDAGSQRAEEYQQNAIDAVDKTNQIKQALSTLAGQFQANEVQNAAANTGAGAQVLSEGLRSDGQAKVQKIASGTEIEKTQMEGETATRVAEIQGDFNTKVQELKNSGSLSDIQAQGANQTMQLLLQHKDFSSLGDTELAKINESMANLFGIDLGVDFWKSVKDKVIPSSGGYSSGGYTSGTQKNDKELTIEQAAEKYNGAMNKAAGDGNFTAFQIAAQQAGYDKEQVKDMWEKKIAGKTFKEPKPTETPAPTKKATGDTISEEQYLNLDPATQKKYVVVHRSSPKRYVRGW